jgi:hypothetical protein
MALRDSEKASPDFSLALADGGQLCRYSLRLPTKGKNEESGSTRLENRGRGTQPLKIRTTSHSSQIKGSVTSLNAT